MTSAVKKFNSDVIQSNQATVVEGAAGRRNFLEPLMMGSLSEVTELSVEQEGFTSFTSFYVKTWGWGECQVVVQ